MAKTHYSKPNVVTLNLTQAQLDLISRGAEAKGATISGFVIQASWAAAERAILEERTLAFNSIFAVER
jgi:uncharacterized protein (DUF1778 family)